MTTSRAAARRMHTRRCIDDWCDHLRSVATAIQDMAVDVEANEGLDALASSLYAASHNLFAEARYLAGVQAHVPQPTKPSPAQK